MPIYRGTVVVSHPSLGGKGTNSWHIRTLSTGGPGDTSLQALTDMLGTFYNTAIGNFAGGASASFDGQWIRVDDGSSDIRTATGWTKTNATSQAPLPPADCIVVAWHTTSAAKSARGRTFLGPYGTNTLENDGAPKSVVVADLSAAASAFIAGFAGGADGAFVVWSKKENIARDIVAGAVKRKYAVLRSRRD